LIHRFLQIIRPIELEIIQIDHFAFLNFNQTLLFCQNLFLPYQFAIFLFYFVCSLNNLSNFSLSRSSNNHHPIIGFRVNKTPFQNKIRCGGIAGSTEKCWFSSPMRSSWAVCFCVAGAGLWRPGRCDRIRNSHVHHSLLITSLLRSEWSSLINWCLT
jgi:hypothetical protein